MWGALILLFLCLIVTACHRGTTVPAVSPDTGSLDPSQDHLKMASYYVRQAAQSRQMAKDQADRALVYERVFGPESDWVAGARLLTQFYENSALDQDRQANLHLELAGQRSNR